MTGALYPAPMLASAALIPLAMSHACRTAYDDDAAIPFPTPIAALLPLIFAFSMAVFMAS